MNDINRGQQGQAVDKLRMFHIALALIALAGGVYFVLMMADMAELEGAEMLVPLAAGIVGFLGVRQVGKDAPPALFVVGGVALAVLSTVAYMLFVKGI